MKINISISILFTIITVHSYAQVNSKFDTLFKEKVMVLYQNGIKYVEALKVE